MCLRMVMILMKMSFDDHHDGDDEFDEDDFDAYATCKRAPSAIPVWLKTMLS